MPENEEALSKLAALSGLIPQETVAGLQTVIQNEPPAPQGQPGQPPATPPQGTAPAGSEPTPQGGQQPLAGNEPPAGTPPETSKKSIFGKKAPAEVVKIESPEKLLEVVKKDFGIEAKTLEDISTFIESSKKWRSESQKAAEIESKYKAIETELSALPSELLGAISEYAKGADWKKAINAKPQLDFSKKYEPSDLVKYYFPDKFSEDDFKDTDKSAALQIAEDAALTKFEAQKQNYEAQVLKVKNDSERQIAAYKGSVESSLSNVKVDFPDMDETILNDVSSTLNGGQKAILSVFFNPDGTVKPTAARAILLAKYNDDVLGMVAQTAANVAEGKLNEELLTRGADAPKPTRQTGTAPTELPEEVKKMMAEIEKIGSKAITFK